MWGIIPKLFPHQETIDKLVCLGINTLKQEGYLQKGDTVVIAGGAKAATEMCDCDADINSSMGGIIKI